VHAVLLSGGSAFGLEAATGVVRYLEEKGVGFPVSVGKVPIVPAAILYDLAIGDWTIRPDAKAGYEAARAASAGPGGGGQRGRGRRGDRREAVRAGGAMKGGVGTASLRLPGGAVVAALVAVNANGDVVDPATGRLLAGVRTPDGKGLRGASTPARRRETRVSPSWGRTRRSASWPRTWRSPRRRRRRSPRWRTTASRARSGPCTHPGTATCSSPCRPGGVAAEQAALLVGVLAAEVVARAVVRAVTTATGLPGYPSASELAPLRIVLWKDCGNRVQGLRIRENLWRTGPGRWKKGARRPWKGCAVMERACG
jgi:hypothetical protein